jgi:hypothetical protein
MEKQFEDLVEAVEESFLEHGVSVEKMRRSIKHIPTSLKLQLGEFFMEQSSHLFKAKSVQEMFHCLSFFWDYLNPGLLIFIIGRFGSEINIDLVTTYASELGLFRKTVKVGKFIRANRTESPACHHYCYKRIVTIMGDDWEKGTLQDVEDYRMELANKLHFQSFLPQIHVRHSSIAVVLSIPHWIQINFIALEPFFRSKCVVKVYLGDVCLIDWTKQVNQYCFATKMVPGVVLNSLPTYFFFGFIHIIADLRGTTNILLSALPPHF